MLVLWQTPEVEQTDMTDTRTEIDIFEMNTVTDNWSTAEQTDITTQDLKLIDVNKLTDNWSGADRQDRHTDTLADRRLGAVIDMI